MSKTRAHASPPTARDVQSGAARGRRLRSWPSPKTDLSNAGADRVHQDVVVDRVLVTSQSPDDMPAFNREVVQLFGAQHRQVGVT